MQTKGGKGKVLDNSSFAKITKKQFTEAYCFR